MRLIAPIAAVLVLSLAPTAYADQVVLQATKDNTLYESATGSISNGAGERLFAGRTVQAEDSRRRALLGFDVASSVPAGATINTVTLTLNMSRSQQAGTEIVGLHRLLSDWGEGASAASGGEGEGAPATAGDATWIHTFYPDVFWGAPGGDFVATPSESIAVSSTRGSYSWTGPGLVADVQDWVDGVAPDYGWLVLSDESIAGTSKRYDSRENTRAQDRPVLVIDFTPPASSGACCAIDGTCGVTSGSTDCAGQGGSYQGDGSSCTPNPCPLPNGACCLPDATATCNEVDETTCAGLGGTFQGALTVCSPNPCPVVLTPFVDPLPLPAVAQPTSGQAGGVASYTMTMREVQQQLHRDLANPTTVWGFGDGANASYPGPTIEATTHKPITVSWVNDLRDTSAGGNPPPLRTDHYLPVDLCPHGALSNEDARTVVHLHGGHVAPEFDGYPEATFPPGQQVTYEYPNAQLPATLWYHDHALGITRLNVYMGLAGFYLIRDNVEEALELPACEGSCVAGQPREYDIPIVIQDRTFNPDGSLSYPETWQDVFFGDTILVNGKVWPYLGVKQGKYRLRLLNGSGSRTYTLALDNGAPFDQIGAEGGLLPAPVTVNEITLGPGERADLVIDFAGYSAGTEIILLNSAPAPFPGPPGEGVVPNVMKFVVQAQAGHTEPLPATLRSMEILDEADALHVREFELEKGPGDACSPFIWEVVSTSVDGVAVTAANTKWEDITEFPDLETTEVWTFINKSGMTHPMHMHLVMFQVLDRQAFSLLDGEVVPIGSPVAPPPQEAGWKDTVQVGPNEIVRVIARFESYSGLFAYHCHILEHEDHEMMRQFNAVSPCSDGTDNDADTFIDYPADPDCTSPNDLSETADCSDGLDNDGDGLSDLDDPGCSGGNDQTEKDATLPCDDGVDNDGDGRIDYDVITRNDPLYHAGLGDPGCGSPSWLTESPECQDGINNDGSEDADIDFDGGASATGEVLSSVPDSECIYPWDTAETPTATPITTYDYTLFEAGHVRPLAMSPDGLWLYVVNTADAYVEAYVPTTSGATHVYSIPVGLEPIAVAARNNGELWVVNHLSDSVSIIDTTLAPPRVVRTLHVGDEPRDIVFANGKAFVTTAHRGQNTPWQDGEYATPGVGRADVWVFDASNPGAGMGGTPITVINLFGDRPRALAVSPDGSRVYAAVFRSGNQTVPVSEGLVCDGSGSCLIQGNSYPAGRPDPEVNLGRCSNNAAERCLSDGDCPGGSCQDSSVNRETGLVVRYDEASGAWLDELGNDWSAAVPFELPDYDVFEIDASAATPVPLGTVSGGIVEGVSHVGTVLFNMVVNPVNGDVYVSNTDANNDVRFRGTGEYVDFGLGKSSGDPASVRGDLAKARVTVLDASEDNLVTPHTEFAVIPRHLNPHIPYDTSPVPADVKEKSIATPMEMAVTSDGSTLYVAGFGSNAVHVYDTNELKNGTFAPTTANIISLPASRRLGITGGASGLLLDEARGLLFVASRTTGEVYMFNTSTQSVVAHLTPHNPEPPEVTDGRSFLYDASLTGSNGEASCSSCHIFGDTDDLSWDLGDPDATPFANNNPKPLQDPHAPFINSLPDPLPFDALKGPMATQSLRGLIHSGPMQWRGDRTGAACEAGIDLDRDPTCETQAFQKVNERFPLLVGRDEGELDPDDMSAFTTFAMRLTYPPNPIRNLDNSLTIPQQAGRQLFSGRLTHPVANCNGCHRLDRGSGFFGTSGGTTDLDETMEFKVPHLRNAYQKVGMFGQMPSDYFPVAPGMTTGPQVRGTGFLHDGSVPRVYDFLAAAVFDQESELTQLEQSDLEAFIMAFDSDLAPIVGQQVTLTDTNLSDVEARIDLLVSESETTFPETGQRHCELIVRGVLDGEARGWVKLAGDAYLIDNQSEPLWTKQDLLDAAAVPGQALTWTCVPPGTGFRMAIDRDRDALWNNVDFAPDLYNSPDDCSIGPATPTSTVTRALLLIGLMLLARRLVRRRAMRLSCPSSQ